MSLGHAAQELYVSDDKLVGTRVLRHLVRY
jgi:hypothetical protein